MEKMREFMINAGLLWLRVLMGAGIAYHGLFKIRTEGRISGLVTSVTNWGFPVPQFWAWAAVLSEFVGGIFIVLGLMTRPAAALIFVTMAVAVIFAHGNDPMFVMHAVPPEMRHKELALCYGVMAGLLIFTGGGKFSLDSVIWPKVFGKKK
jgi:putative oxidoreductase